MWLRMALSELPIDSIAVCASFTSTLEVLEMDEKDIHNIGLMIKAHTDITIIFEALTRLTRELTELTQELSKQEATSGKLFSKN